MNTVVVYKSKTGFTKRYAEWIAKDLGCEAFSENKVSAKSLEPYQTIIYGGGIMAGQISGLKKIKSIMTSLPNKKLIVFATGAASYEAYIEKDEIKDANFTQEEKKKIPYFYLWGGINYENMGFFSKRLMKMFASMLGKKKDQTPEEQRMAATIKSSCDFSDPKYIAPLVQCVRGQL